MPVKKCLLFLVLAIFLAPTLGSSQTKLPAFKFTTYNGKTFTAAQVPANKPLLLVYFLPDCGHCQNLTKELTTHMNWFSKASVVMLTCQPVQQVAAFVKDYGLSKYPNMHIGTEINTLMVRNLYRIDELPFMALYNKSGSLVKVYSRNDKLQTVSARLKTLL